MSVVTETRFLNIQLKHLKFSCIQKQTILTISNKITFRSNTFTLEITIESWWNDKNEISGLEILLPHFCICLLLYSVTEMKTFLLCFGYHTEYSWLPRMESQSYLGYRYVKTKVVIYPSAKGFKILYWRSLFSDQRREMTKSNVSSCCKVSSSRTIRSICKLMPIFDWHIPWIFIHVMLIHTASVPSAAESHHLHH